MPDQFDYLPQPFGMPGPLPTLPQVNAGPYGLPFMPAMPPRAELRNLAPRPGDAMAPVSQQLADVMVGPAAAGYGGGRMMGTGYEAGSVPEAAAGAGMAMLGGLGYRGQPKWVREMERADRFSPDKSHAGMAPWFGAGAGAAGGAYLGHELVDQPSEHGGTGYGAALGGVLGAGFGTAGLLRYIKQLDEMERAAVAARPPTGGTGAAPQVVQAAPRPRLAERLGNLASQRTNYDVLREHMMKVGDAASPLGPPATAGQATRTVRGEKVTTDAAGRWRTQGGRFHEGPDSARMSEGFPDSWTADLERAARRRPEPGPAELAAPQAPTGASAAETLPPPPGAPPGGSWLYQGYDGTLHFPSGEAAKRGWRKGKD
jgi:hypothetical protein